VDNAAMVLAVLESR